MHRGVLGCQFKDTVRVAGSLVVTSVAKIDVHILLQQLSLEKLAAKSGRMNPAFSPVLVDGNEIGQRILGLVNSLFACLIKTDPALGEPIPLMDPAYFFQKTKKEGGEMGGGHCLD